MRPLLLATALLAVPHVALAGTVTVDVGGVHQVMKVEPDVEARQAFAVGRFQVRLVVLETTDPRGFRFRVRLERYQGEHVEVLAEETLVTGKGVDVMSEQDTKLGAFALRCRG